MNTIQLKYLLLFRMCFLQIRGKKFCTTATLNADASQPECWYEIRFKYVHLQQRNV